MRIAPVAEIKAQFSSYVKEAADGPVVITKNGKPVAVLIGVTDEDEIERLILAYSPKFQAMLNAAEERIRVTGGIPHDEFWQKLDAEYVDSASVSPNHPNLNGNQPPKRQRKSAAEATLQKVLA